MGLLVESVAPVVPTTTSRPPPTPIANVGDIVGTEDDIVPSPAAKRGSDAAIRAETRPLVLGSVALNAGRRARTIRRGTGGGLLAQLLTTFPATLNKSFAGPLDDSSQEQSLSFSMFVASLIIVRACHGPVAMVLGLFS